MLGFKLSLVNSIHFVFAVYTLMLFLYIVSSWVPNLRQYAFMRFVAQYTEPYLGIFKQLIPPIGGVLDLSPILGFMALKFLEPILINLIIRFF